MAVNDAGTVHRVTVESIAAGGDGVARVQNMVCFIPRTAPQDVVDVTLRTRKRFATGRVLRVVEPSPMRTEPRCRHYHGDDCGGCQLQHMTASAQREARGRIVRDALQRIARQHVALPEVVAGPRDWEYRRRLTLALRRRGDRFIGGLHRLHNADDVFMLEECPISAPQLVEVWHAIRPVMRNLPSQGSLRLALRLLDDGRVAVVLHGGVSWPGSRAWGREVCTRSALVREAWWERAGGALQKLAPDDDSDVADADALAFVQVNSAVGDILRGYVRTAVSSLSPGHVVEAYAGSGRLAEELASQGIKVTAIEVDANATRRAEERLRGFPFAKVITSPVQQALGTVLDGEPDVLIVNPPRRGLEPELPPLMDTAASLRRLVYISCDPATLARDLSQMPSWRIDSVRCFDMFPQTAHVETVCILKRESA